MTDKAVTPAFLAGGGELGELTRAKDWSQTALGTPDQWPQSLRTTVGLILHAPSPLLLWWGPDLIQFYNDACRPGLDSIGKHPTALGQRGELCWPEAWPAIRPLIDRVLAGESIGGDDQLIPIHHNGRIGNVYWTVSYSPVWNEAEQVAGILVTCRVVSRQVTTAPKEIQARQPVEANDRQLQSLIAQAPVGIAIVRGPALVFEMANAVYLTLTGRTAPGDLLGKPLLEAMPELSEQGFDTLLRDVLRTGKPFTATERRADLLRNGQLETGYFNFTYEPLREADDTISGVFMLAAEVTPQVIARQQAEVNEAYLQRVFRVAAVGMAIFWGPEFIIEVANPNICILWGRTEAQVIGKPLFEALPEAAGQGFEELLTDVMRTGTPFIGTELPVTLDRNGQLTTVYFDFVYDALPDADGQRNRILVTASDATERRQARRQAEASAAGLRSLFQQAPVAIAILRGPAFVVELANPGMCEVWNRTEEQLLGNPVFEVLTESAGHGFEELLTAVMQTGVPYVGSELPVPFLRNGQSTTVYVNFVYEPLREGDQSDGPITGIVAVGVDVTEQVLTRQQAEQLLVRERELNELKSNFVTLASHEFRNPMGTILSSAALIGRYEGPDDVERRERHVQRIRSAVNSLTGLLNDFLSLSQMEQTTMYGKPHPLNIVTFCDEIVDDIQGVIKPGQRVVYTHQSAELVISLDGQMLKNILINLLVNASKYSADGKEIELTTAVRGDQLLLTVRDEGIGIPDADKDKLFISFFRARNAIHIQGTGLGLYVAKRYVDLLGGTIIFTSQLDSGTIFTIQLPLSPIQT
ncbi:MAG: PAS domain-containing protein [Bacteroidetes bacterium]|nr:PAS domain-containing protein [Fibrella sp.]